VAAQHIVLVPGFFGFVNFGPVVYFAHVREFLVRELRARGVEAEVHRTRTHPVASLRQRARDLRDFIAALPEGPVHIVGHSTGGLDARLLTSPDVDLGGSEVEPHAARVRSVISLCTPHRGSPLASHLAGMVGEPLLRTFSLLTILALRHGRLPVRLSLRFARALVGERLLPNTPVHVVLQALEREAAQALTDACLTDEERLSVTEFMRELQAEPHLIPQLMPQALDVFNAGIGDRPGIRYGCVVARCPAPSIRTQLSMGNRPYEHATHLFYQWLYRRVTPLSPEFHVPLDEAQREFLRTAWGSLPTAYDSDGVVPTASQVHGRVIHAAIADHLDVIGHLQDPDSTPGHHDWLASGSGFGRQRFEALWRDVVAAILEEP
jgi:triacylglycerol lipase